MGAYDQGGGGAKAGASTTDIISLDKPYDIYGEWSLDMAQNLDEMLRYLYLAVKRTNEPLSNITSQRLLGRYASSSGTPQEISIGTGLSLSSAGALTATASGSGTGTGGSIGALAFKSVQLGTAELDVLDSTPVTMVTAQGANTQILPMWWALYCTKDTGAWAISTVGLRCYYSGSTGTTLLNTINTNLSVAAAGSVTSSAGIVSKDQIATSISLNKDVLMDTATALSAATRTATLDVVMAYHVITFA